MASLVSHCYYLLAVAIFPNHVEQIVNGNWQIKWRMNNETTACVLQRREKKNKLKHIHTIEYKSKSTAHEKIERQRTNINKNIK